MKMHPVSSSNISAIGHHGTVMEVKYRSGATYRFESVTPEQFNQIMSAQSKGKALAAMGLKGVKV